MLGVALGELLRNVCLNKNMSEIFHCNVRNSTCLHDQGWFREECYEMSTYIYTNDVPHRAKVVAGEHRLVLDLEGTLRDAACHFRNNTPWKGMPIDPGGWESQKGETDHHPFV